MININWWEITNIANVIREIWFSEDFGLITTSMNLVGLDNSVQEFYFPFAVFVCSVRKSGDSYNLSMLRMFIDINLFDSEEIINLPYLAGITPTICGDSTGFVHKHIGGVVVTGNSYVSKMYKNKNERPFKDLTISASNLYLFSSNCIYENCHFLGTTIHKMGMNLVRNNPNCLLHMVKNFINYHNTIDNCLIELAETENYDGILYLVNNCHLIGARAIHLDFGKYNPFVRQNRAEVLLGLLGDVRGKEVEVIVTLNIKIYNSVTYDFLTTLRDHGYIISTYSIGDGLWK